MDRNFDPQRNLLYPQVATTQPDIAELIERQRAEMTLSPLPARPESEIVDERRRETFRKLAEPPDASPLENPFRSGTAWSRGASIEERIRNLIVSKLAYYIEAASIR